MAQAFPMHASFAAIMHEISQALPMAPCACAYLGPFDGQIESKAAGAQKRPPKGVDKGWLGVDAD